MRAAAERLMRAASSGEPCAPVRDLIGDVEGAYAVQSAVTAHRVAAGAQVVGRKVGLTSLAVQAQLGVDAPDFGVLFDDLLRRQDEPIPMAGLLQPRIEAEVAFVLSADLDGDTSPAAVRAATAHVCAALEIVDSRVAGWDITLIDTVADNASCGAYVLGDRQLPLAGLDLPAVTMRLLDGDGVEVSTGTGAACLGDPIDAVSWLATTAAALGAPLRAGDVILSGALGPMVTVTPGSRFTAELSELGPVQARFGE